jgi:signal transduction histidine kinase
VAILEDDIAEAGQLIRLLDTSWPDPVESRVFADVAELEAHLPELRPDVVFCGLAAPDGVGLEVVERVVAVAGEAPVVVLTSNVDPETPIEVLRAGAQDYLTRRSLDGESLGRTLRYSMARRAVEMEKRRVEKSLGQLHRELDRYAGIMAHDLRAPVRTARLFADRLVAMTCTEMEPPAVAQALDSSLERLEMMIGRLQRIATLRDAVLEPVEQPVTVIVEDVVTGLSAELDDGGATVVCADRSTILADGTLIREALSEIVQNSIKYRCGSRDLLITVSVESSPLTTAIIVSDNGIGIASPYRDRVFRLFERLSSVESSGLGFGLAFCEQVAEMHGGCIRAVDPDGPHGTAIKITLPSG